MPAYNINLEKVAVGEAPATLFRVGFGEPAQNDAIVRDAASRMAELAEIGGELALINGPASLPAAVVISHGLIHRFAAVGVFDPKLDAYVVASSHGSVYGLGDLIPSAEVAPAE